VTCASCTLFSSNFSSMTCLSTFNASWCASFSVRFCRQLTVWDGVAQLTLWKESCSDC
jgi:hypothetical protein